MVIVVRFNVKRVMIMVWVYVDLSIVVRFFCYFYLLFIWFFCLIYCCVDNWNVCVFFCYVVFMFVNLCFSVLSLCGIWFVKGWVCFWY